MNELLSTLLHAYARLAPRERMLLQAAVAASAVTILALVVSGVQGAKAELRTRIAAKERQLEDVHRLRREYVRLQQRTSAATDAEAPKDFSLFSFLDGIGKNTVTREKVLALSPSSRTVGDDFVEQAVEMKLSGVSLTQLVSVLHQIQNAPTPLGVSRLQMKKQTKDPYSFDVTLVVTSLSAA